MPEVTTEEWYNIANAFEEKTNFPNCLGAIDGKHVRCMKPRSSGSKFFNYKKFFSVVLMAVADANLRFVSIDVGSYGQEGDSTVFRDSVFRSKLYSEQLNIPQPKLLPGTNDDPQPFVFIGDEAFKVHTNLLRPFAQRELIIVNEFVITDIQGLDVQWSAHLDYWRISGRFFTDRSWLHLIL